MKILCIFVLSQAFFSLFERQSNMERDRYIYLLLFHSSYAQNSQRLDQAKAGCIEIQVSPVSSKNPST